MGKTAGGAVWLDAERTSPYEYFQYWVNVDDKDVARFLALFTFLPMEEIKATGTLKDADLNAAKSILAYETTRLVHGANEAENAIQASCSTPGTYQACVLKQLECRESLFQSLQFNRRTWNRRFTHPLVIPGNLTRRQNP